MYCTCVCAHDKSRTVTRPVFITPRNFSCDKFRLVLFLYFLKPQSGMKKTYTKNISLTAGRKSKYAKHTHTHSHAHGHTIYTGTRTNILAPVCNVYSWIKPSFFFTAHALQQHIYSARAGKVFTANIIYSSVSGFKSRLRVSAELCKRRILPRTVLF